MLVRFVIYLALPALVFQILIGAELDGALILVPIAAFAIHFLLLGLSWTATRVWGMERPRAGALIVATAVGNTGFFGLPLIAASGSDFSLPAAVMYDSLATGLITWTSTVAVATAYGRADHEPKVSTPRPLPLAAAAAELGARGGPDREPGRAGTTCPPWSSAPSTCWPARCCR